MICVSVNLSAQVTIGSGAEPSPWSLLYLDASEQRKALHNARMTTAERDILVPPYAGYRRESERGLMIFNITNNCLEFWNGRDWISLCEGDEPPINLPKPDPSTRAHVTAFINVIYDFQTQRLETFASGGVAPSLWQWQVSTDNVTFTNIAGAMGTDFITTGAIHHAVWTLPADFMHNVQAPNANGDLYFRTIMLTSDGAITQAENYTLQIRFIQTTESGGGSDFLPGFGIDTATNTRYAVMSRASHLGMGPDYIRVALLNVGATDTDGVGLGSLFQWGRRADGHEVIVWENNPSTRLNRFGAGTSATIGRGTNAEMTANVDANGQVTGVFVGRFIISPNANHLIDTWGEPRGSVPGSCRMIDLWGNMGHQRANSPTSLAEWTDRARNNNPCPDGWRVPTSFDLIDIMGGTGFTDAHLTSDKDAANFDGRFYYRRRTTASGAVLFNCLVSGAQVIAPYNLARTVLGVQSSFDARGMELFHLSNHNMNPPWSSWSRIRIVLGWNANIEYWRQIRIYNFNTSGPTPVPGRPVRCVL